MTTYMSVKEALEAMQSTVDEDGKVKLNRFNKKKFNELMVALANDIDFTTQVARSINGGEDCAVEDVAVSKEFRKWCRKLVEKAGVDKMESEKVMRPEEFTITDMAPFYDFFCTAMVEYMNAGNYFSIPNSTDLEATFAIKRNPKKTVQKESYTPGTAETRKFLGVFETTYDDHRTIVVKSSCPSYKKKRKKVK